MKYRIREICRQRKISLRQLAEDAELNHIQMLALLWGNPSLASLVRIANSLKVRVVDLLVE